MRDRLLKKIQFERLVDNLAPAMLLTAGIVALLAWAGPNFRTALSGQLLEPWMERVLAVSYVLAVIAAVGSLVWAVAEPGLDRRRQERTFMQVTESLGKALVEASGTTQALYALPAPQRAAKAKEMLVKLLKSAVDIFGPLPGHNRALLLVPEKQDDRIMLVPHPKVHHGFQEKELIPILLPADDGTTDPEWRSIAGYVFKNGTPHYAPVAQRDKSYYELPGQQGEPAQSIICVPVVLSEADEPRAILSVDSSIKRAFLRENIAHLKILSYAISDVLALSDQSGQD